MTDPILAPMLKHLAELGYVVSVTPHGEGWRAECVKDGERYFAASDTELRAVCLLAESAGFDLE